ncbi:fumarylacetoacetate hydrolase family protein [Noviherbaspirillum agri]
MTDSHSPTAVAASILAERRKDGAQGPRLPESCRPNDIDDALAIQKEVTTLLGERIGAWKCGTPFAERRVLAPIHASQIHTGSPCRVRVQRGEVRIEPELAFILGRDLPPRDAPYLPEEIDAAIVVTHLALELIESRYDDPAAAGFVDNLADGLLNQGLFIGPQVDGDLARHAAAIPLCVRLESGEEKQLDGRHPDGNPRAPLYWLAEFLRARNEGLEAGQAVITGSYAGSFDVPADQDIAIEYGGLGTLHVRFCS